MNPQPYLETNTNSMYVGIVLYPSSLNRLLWNNISTTSVRELGYLFLTESSLHRIGSDPDVKDHTAMDEFLDDVKSYNTNRNLLLYKIIML